jgi:hypothetical protein
LNFRLETGHIFGGLVKQVRTWLQLLGVPHVVSSVEQAVPTAGQPPPGEPASPPGATQTGEPQLQYQCRPVLPPSTPELDEPELEPELDELPHLPVTTSSQPWPQYRPEAQPSAGLWQANPLPPSGYRHE